MRCFRRDVLPYGPRGQVVSVQRMVDAVLVHRSDELASDAPDGCAKERGVAPKSESGGCCEGGTCHIEVMCKVVGFSLRMASWYRELQKSFEVPMKMAFSAGSIAGDDQAPGSRHLAGTMT